MFSSVWCVAAVWLGLPLAVVRAEAAPGGSLGAIVHVVGSSTVPRWELARAELEVTRAFSRIGVELDWRHDGPAGEMDGPRHLTLVLLSESGTRAKAERERLDEAVLGSSVPPASRAYIFCPRLDRLARAGNVHLADSLAYVMTHEIGHLLLPDAGHADAGVMRPVLPPPGGTAALQFTAAETAAIRRSLAASTAARLAALPRAAVAPSSSR